VRFDTTFGQFDVEMLPGHAPNHVQNFLSYVGEAAFDNTIIHRSVAFGTGQTTASIVQGGSDKAVVPPTQITTKPAVALEYSQPNSRGTLAAARTSEPNSATSGWYFNATDNTTTLGPANDGFGYTAFGQ